MTGVAGDIDDGGGGDGDDDDVIDCQHAAAAAAADVHRTLNQQMMGRSYVVPGQSTRS